MNTIRTISWFTGIVSAFGGTLLLLPPLNVVSAVVALLLMTAGCILAEWGTQTEENRKIRRDRRVARGR